MIVQPHTPARGFLLVAAIMGTLLMVVFALALFHFAALDVARERAALLDSVAHQLIESARAWAAVHAAELEPGRPFNLAADELLPPGASATVELRQTGEAASPRIECRVSLQRGRSQMSRRLSWPAPMAAASGPTPE